MVRLTKIYTRTGDQGRTMLGDGSLAPKTSPRVEAYGDVDELNAFVGAAIAACPDDATGEKIREILTSVQQDLFDVGADLCTPKPSDEKPGDRLRVSPEQTRRLERLIDEHNAGLSELNSFVLPGGSPLAATLHTARAVARRAERRVAALIEAESDRVNAETLVYVNRLSDLLFVVARVANAGSTGDVLWKPGANRPNQQGDKEAGPPESA